MAEWTSEQQNEFTNLYSQLEKLPGYNKKRANNQLFPNPKEPLDYNDAKSRLVELVKEFSGQNHDLENVVKNETKNTNPYLGFNQYRSAVGLGVLATLLLYLV